VLSNDVATMMNSKNCKALVPSASGFGWAVAEKARENYRKSLSLTQQEPERRFLERRLREL
jgi:hypothetical protein